MIANNPSAADLAPNWLGRLAGLWPDRVAVIDPDEPAQHTFADLHRSAGEIAGGLAERGVGQGDRVCAMMQSGVPLLELLFACGQIGAILVPMNWRLSDRELGNLLSDADPALVVSDARFEEAAQRVSEGARRFEGIVGNALPAPALVHMSDPWIILYTGGTTGTPKGAVLTHGSVTWNAINTTVSWGLLESDIGPSFTPMFHTGGLNVFTLPLLMLGAKVILPRAFDPGQALRILEKYRPTVLFLVPTMFQMVAELPEFADADLSSLRWAISGGAPCPAPVYELWRPKVPVFKQGYGLTEVGPNNFATPDADAVAKQGTVGRLTYFAHARIVDDHGSDLPDGEPGELLLAGPHMCAGYWRNPEATASAIRGGWFHTGDVARRDADGYFYIVDRKKDMIISGGENIYSPEVERVLAEHPAVMEVAIFGIPDEKWGEAVKAAVALNPGMTATEQELLDWCRERLAHYKCPKSIDFLPALPRNPTGKILKRDLRQPYWEGHASAVV